MKSETWLLGSIIGSGLMMGIIVALIIYNLDLQNEVHSLLRWIDETGPLAPLAFICVEIIVVLVLFPGALVTMGAGFLFGVTMGSLYVVIGTTCGALIAFVTARYFLSERAINTLKSYPHLKFVDRALSVEGWRIVLLTRLIPFFPFKLSNYLFGISKFSLRDFFIGTVIGIWPFTIFNVYIGSLVANLTVLGAEETKSPTSWGIYFLGLVVAIFSIIFLSRRARIALKSYQADSKDKATTVR